MSDALVADAHYCTLPMFLGWRSTLIFGWSEATTAGLLAGFMPLETSRWASLYFFVVAFVLRSAPMLFILILSVADRPSRWPRLLAVWNRQTDGDICYWVLHTGADRLTLLVERNDDLCSSRVARLLLDLCPLRSRSLGFVRCRSTTGSTPRITIRSAAPDASASRSSLANR